MPTFGPNNTLEHLQDHETWMREAIQLAIDKMQAGEGGPFGAVIVKDDQVIGRGWNQVTSTNDPTAHAEVVAIRNACQNQQHFSLHGCRIYCSCQPCPMCHGAILWARIDSIFFAATTEQAAQAGFDDQAFRDQLLANDQHRTVPLIPLLAHEALAPFAAWQQLASRVRY